MSKRAGAKYLMLTHLAPALGTARNNRWNVPGSALTQADYRDAMEPSGFTVTNIVGTDLAVLRLSPK
jgi:ribonuclease Z